MLPAVKEGESPLKLFLFDFDGKHRAGLVFYVIMALLLSSQKEGKNALLPFMLQFLRCCTMDCFLLNLPITIRPKR